MNPFAGDVVDVQFQNLCAGGICLGSFNAFFPGRIVLDSQAAQFIKGLLLIGNKVNLAEYDDAVQSAGPVPFRVGAFVQHAEGYFPVGLKGIDFVSFFRAVKVDLVFAFGRVPKCL